MEDEEIVRQGDLEREREVTKVGAVGRRLGGATETGTLCFFLRGGGWDGNLNSPTELGDWKGGTQGEENS